jgi:hypothetical protein
VFNISNDKDCYFLLNLDKEKKQVNLTQQYSPFSEDILKDQSLDIKEIKNVDLEN